MSDPEILDGTPVALGGPRGLEVTRTLPSKHRRMVGAWCFLDAYGPHRLAGTAGMRVGPHPHIGLQTVSWLVAGEIVHRDSLGSHRRIRPGQLNLMTAGRGISHSEETPADHSGVLQGVQLWVALPDSDRSGPPAFSQHADLPVVTSGGLTATVLMGELGGARSPARCYTPLLGAELTLAAGSRSVLPLRPSFEYAVLVLDGAATVAGRAVGPGPLLYLDEGRNEVRLETDGGARLMLLGGEPFTERMVMWWNFVGRDHDEIVAARQAWEDRELLPPAERAGGTPAGTLPAGTLPAGDVATGGRAGGPLAGSELLGAGVSGGESPAGEFSTGDLSGRGPTSGVLPAQDARPEDGVFGRVRGYDGPDIPAPPMPITRLVARGRTR